MSRLIVLFFILLFASALAQATGLQCTHLFVRAIRLDQDNSVTLLKNFPQILQQTQGEFSLKVGDKVQLFTGSLANLLQSNEIFRAALDVRKNTPHQIIGSFKYPSAYTHQTLRLVTLDLTDYNRNFNHQEMVALLNVNPQLAAKLGFFKIEGFENIILIPDMATLNERLSLLAQESGSGAPIWSYEQAKGVLGFEPYIRFLGNGKFPFAIDKDPNLFVHDSLHAVAFAALNSTPAARRLAYIAKLRSEIFYKIIERLRSELKITEDLMAASQKIASDPMERTMLLTILMSGNYKYMSAGAARQKGALHSQQNRQTTIERVQNVLRVVTQGARDFKSLYDYLVQYKHKTMSPADQILLLRIFQEETSHLERPTEIEIEQASRDIVQNFFSKTIFEEAPGGLINESADTSLGVESYPTYAPAERPFPVSPIAF